MGLATHAENVKIQVVFGQQSALGGMSTVADTENGLVLVTSRMPVTTGVIFSYTVYVRIFESGLQSMTTDHPLGNGRQPVVPPNVHWFGDPLMADPLTGKLGTHGSPAICVAE